MVKKKQKVYLSLGIICLQTTLMADGLASILVSQKTKDSVIENKNFDGKNLYSFLWGSTDFLSSSLGSYITIGGTVDFRSDEDKKRDEKSGDFDNYLSYNVYNTGLTYTPTNNLTLLGGVGYGQSKGRYYQKNSSSSDYHQVTTEKERGVNFNLAVNYYYKSIGLVAMYDTFPKVFSVGVSYNFGTNSNNLSKKSNSRKFKKANYPIDTQGLVLPEEIIKGKQVYLSPYGGEIRQYKNSTLFYTNNHSYDNGNLFKDDMRDLALHIALLEKTKILSKQQGNEYFYKSSVYQLDLVKSIRRQRTFINPLTSLLAVGTLAYGAYKLVNLSNKLDERGIALFHSSPSLHIGVRNGGFINTPVKKLLVEIKGVDDFNQYISINKSYDKSSGFLHFDNLVKGNYKIIINGNTNRNETFSFVQKVYFHGNSKECKVIDLKNETINSSTCKNKLSY